jgi:hypothetical protein
LRVGVFGSGGVVGSAGEEVGAGLGGLLEMQKMDVSWAVILGVLEGMARVVLRRIWRDLPFQRLLVLICLVDLGNLLART